MHKLIQRTSLVGSICASVLYVGQAKAGNLYFQGFETDTSGWNIDSGGQGTGSVTRTASGTGPLGLTAYQGGNYGTIVNNKDAYSDCCLGVPGWGTGGFSTLGNPVAGPNTNPYPGSDFGQSIAVYIDTSLIDNPTFTQAFWIDGAPASSDPNDIPNGGTGFGAEHNFRLAYTGAGGVNVTVDGQTTPIADITNSGWYNFDMVYTTDGNATDLVQTYMEVFDALGNGLGYSVVPANADGETLQNQYLQGAGYLWMTVWENGFSPNGLGIDNVSVDTVDPSQLLPEPSTWFLMLTGFGAVIAGAIQRQRCFQRVK
jgi:hypothetical protein